MERTKVTNIARKLLVDPRHYQIAVLASLLTYGLVALDFEIAMQRVVVIVLTALATQYVCTRIFKLPRFDARSAGISALSLCLLLRTNSLALAAITAVITIGSKFLLRWNGKHLFNPTNFGIVVMILLTGSVWVSPGQWGNVAFFGFLMACLGGLVVNRAARSDVAYAFIVVTLGLVFGRALWVGEPMTIPLHRLESGALLLFTFFMISDPKTTPNSRTGRLVFATMVAFTAWYIQYRLFRTNGLLWSLALWSAAVPLIDWLLPGTRYNWPGLSSLKGIPQYVFSKGDINHETSRALHARPWHPGLVWPGADRVLRFLRR
jgi:Na+-transporting NADH:ubiquinone oxidoreductase subunit NqrB